MHKKTKKNRDKYLGSGDFESLDLNHSESM